MKKIINHISLFILIVCFTISTVNVSAQCNFSLGNDTSICSPSSLHLNGPMGFTSYSWSPGGAITQGLTVSTSGIYALTGTLLSGDLVVNGNFSAGNVGFVSSYGPPAGGTWGPLSNAGTYTISTSPNLTHNNFMSFGDHTTGTGNMFVCNGSSIANTIVWTETISVIPNTNYNFSAWVASVLPNLNSGDEAQMQFSINGVLIGPIHHAPLTGGIWSNFYVVWNSGANTSAIIRIVDQSTNSGSNDFALDDIFFQEVCVHTDSITVTVNPIPSISSSASPSTICSGWSSSLTASSNVAGTTYSWMPGSLTGSPVSVNPGTTTTYTVSGTAATCVGTSTVTVTVNPGPVVSATATPSVICTGGTSQLAATSTVAGTTYNWMPGSLNGSPVSVSPLTSTTYIVTGTALGCTDTASVTITVNPIPIIQISPASPSICFGDSISLYASSNIANTTYSWDNGVNNDSIRVSPPNTISFKVIGTSNACYDSASVIVIVNPIPQVNILPINPTICYGDSISLIASSNLASTNFTWDNSSNTSSIYVGPTVSTPYYVIGVSNLCVDTAFINVTVNPLPVVTITADNNPICEGVTSTLTAGSSIPSTTYYWNTNSTSNNISVTPSSSTYYYVTGTINNCHDSTSILISVIPTQYVNLGPDRNICEGDEVILNASSLTGSFLWSDGSTSSSIIVSVAGLYWLTVNNSGCLASDTVVLDPCNEIWVPTGFSPNGDGKNDFFKSEHTGIETLSMYIFDRWGENIFTTYKIGEGWDGLYQGKEVQQGVYFWVIKYFEKIGSSALKEKEIHGTVTLFR